MVPPGGLCVGAVAGEEFAAPDFVAILLRSWRYSRLFNGGGLKPARGMSTFEFVDSSFPPQHGSVPVSRAMTGKSPAR